MPKLTQKAKIIEAISFAQSILSKANYLDYVCKDDDYREGRKVAKEITDSTKEFLKLMR